MVSLELLRTKYDGWSAPVNNVMKSFAECATSADKSSDDCRVWAQYLREHKPQTHAQHFKRNQETGRYEYAFEPQCEVTRYVEIPREYGALAAHFASWPFFADEMANLRRVSLMAVLPPLEALRQLGPWFSYQDSDELRAINTEATCLYNRDKRSMASIVYGLTVMLCSDYLRPCKVYRVWPLTPKACRARRFWCIVQRLPIELQAVVALRVDGKDGVIVPMSHFMWQAVGAMTAA